MDVVDVVDTGNFTGEYTKIKKYQRYTKLRQKCKKLILFAGIGLYQI